MLDLVGLFTRQRALLLAGWYYLVLAAISSVVALTTGFTAMMTMRLPFKGIMLNHMFRALGTSLVMWMMVSLRVHRHEQMNIPLRFLYTVLAVAGLVLVALTGHLGAMYVYGQ